MSSFTNLLKSARQYGCVNDSTVSTFEMDASNIRFRPDITSEIGMSSQTVNARKWWTFRIKVYDCECKFVVKSLDIHNVNYYHDTNRV
ncbi:hypothetical protein BJV82DRAFT_266263 [Fennellomyces sp. T-0311]|nr:hypothetical protein BJV82DRAFT_266263 [Fennellomyces sp. T-0311]